MVLSVVSDCLEHTHQSKLPEGHLTHPHSHCMCWYKVLSVRLRGGGREEDGEEEVEERSAKSQEMGRTEEFGFRC